MRSDVRTSRTTTGPAVLLLISLFALGIGSARPQSQSTQGEIQQPRDKLQQLDQMMDEVKAEINTLERQSQQPASGTQKAPEKPQGGVVAIPSESVSGAPPNLTLCRWKVK